MEILEVDEITYERSVKALSLFTRASFAVLNQEKVKEVKYLLFKETKVRLGIILGVRDNMLFSPFSAPYGGFSFAEADCKAKFIDEAIACLNDWCISNRFVSIKLALPPLHYVNQFQTRVINALHNNQFMVSNVDVNHHFETPKNNFDTSYPSMMHRNARKNINNALKKDFQWLKLAEDDSKRAYEIIAVNRAAKQKPLRMTWEQVLEVTEITKVDFFVASHQQRDVASAIVFHVNESSIQVVYWGDDPAFYELRAMNFLTYKLFQHYSELGIETIDIGISTEDSVPNYGLCEFKESIGCQISLKYTFFKKFE